MSRSDLHSRYIGSRKSHARLMGWDDVPKFNPIKLHSSTFMEMVAEEWSEYDAATNTLDGHGLIVNDSIPKGIFYFALLFRMSGKILFVGGPTDPILRDIDDWKPFMVVRRGNDVYQYELTRKQTEMEGWYMEYSLCQGSVIVDEAPVDTTSSAASQ